MLFWVVVLEYPQRKNKMTFCSDSFIFVLLYLEDIYRTYTKSRLTKFLFLIIF
jgi:hypothetical protein